MDAPRQEFTGKRALIEHAATERKSALKEALAFTQTSSMPITFEIGCGNGHYLAAYANEHPEKLCIGIDLLGQRLKRSNNKKRNHQLENLHFIKAEAGEFVEAFPQDVLLNEVFILFPDPWPKRKHHKNRLIQTEFLTKLAEICKMGASLHFRTDHQAYFDWAKEHIKAHPLWAITSEIPWPLEVETLFQQRAPSHNSLIAKRLPS